MPLGIIDAGGKGVTGLCAGSASNRKSFRHEQDEVEAEDTELLGEELEVVIVETERLRRFMTVAM